MPLTLLHPVICIKNSLLGSCKRCCCAGQDHFWNKTRVKLWNPWNTLRSTQSAHQLTFTCQPNMSWVVFHPVVFVELQLFQIKKNSISTQPFQQPRSWIGREISRAAKNEEERLEVDNKALKNRAGTMYYEGNRYQVGMYFFK